ncbi:MAG: BamA/TamA family outer membrane protein [Sporocytophaga sp.]|uniref:BamA/TamA family outer membrane protein n=1 Tax=Sporocytophaga sp. TaxID=2231183 RepID=UPI001B1A56C0|nr:BamA/TamA family outer membrane protein [Sporocytophaga sp.]MBO9700963.1 BamA/TamA family outer membrane protein [Sporocytophaga sp.]
MSFKFFIFFISFLIPTLIFAQTNSQSEACDTSFIIINNIKLDGNKRTKDKIILRELSVFPGDTICKKELEPLLIKTRNRIFNTGLFLKADVILIGDSILRELKIVVKERLFTYPLPILSLADRNFNEWWYTRNHDLSRIDYGVNFIKKNVRGMNETLRLKVNAGFSTKAELTYTIPYLDRKQRIGLTLFSGIIENKKIPYRTLENELAYYEGKSFVRRRITGSVTFSYRRRFYEFHSLSLGFFTNRISDTIAELNPDYFLKQRVQQNYFDLKYTFTFDRRDITFYPLKGFYIKAEVDKQGLLNSDDVNIFSFKTDGSVYQPLGKGFFVAAGTALKYSTPSKQPYFNIRGLGYMKDYISGYELFVIDGSSYSLFKTNIKYRLFKTEKKLSFLPTEKIRSIPLTLYLKTYFDTGYVVDQTYTPGNAILSNQWLWGGGFGFDLVTYYDLVFRFEYSVNKQLQTGLFLSLKAAI